jgi:hypothetical protein
MSASAARQIARFAGLFGPASREISESALSGITFPSSQRTTTPGCELCRPSLVSSVVLRAFMFMRQTLS